MGPEPLQEIARQHWRWRGAFPLAADQATAVVRQAIETALDARSVKLPSRNMIVARVGGVLPFAFAATEEVVATVHPTEEGSILEVTSRSTQFVVTDNGRNRRNIQVVVGVLGLETT